MVVFQELCQTTRMRNRLAGKTGALARNAVDLNRHFIDGLGFVHHVHQEVVAHDLAQCLPILALRRLSPSTQVPDWSARTTVTTRPEQRQRGWPSPSGSHVCTKQAPK